MYCSDSVVFDSSVCSRFVSALKNESCTVGEGATDDDVVVLAIDVVLLRPAVGALDPEGGALDADVFDGGFTDVEATVSFLGGTDRLFDVDMVVEMGVSLLDVVVDSVSLSCPDSESGIEEAEGGVFSVVLTEGEAAAVSGMVVIVLTLESLVGTSEGEDVASNEVIEESLVVCGAVAGDCGWGMGMLCSPSSGWVVDGGLAACEVDCGRYIYSK